MPSFRLLFLLGLALFFSASLTLYAQDDIIIDRLNFNEDELFLMLDTEEPNVALAPRRAFGGIGAILQAIFSLLIVIGLIFVTLHLLRKGSGHAPIASSSVIILAHQTLKAGASLMVVDVADKVLVLGVGDNVNLLAEVTDQEMIDQLRLTSPVPASASFVSLLSKRLTQKGHSPNARVSSPKDFLGKHTSNLVKPTKPREDSRHDS